MACTISLLLSYCCLLCSLSSIVWSEGNLFQRNRDFDDLFKGGSDTIVYNASGSGPCGMYATRSLCSSFFFNEITYECQLMYKTVSDVTDAVSYPGNRYFVKAPVSTSQVCSTAALMDGFTFDQTSGLCYKVFRSGEAWSDVKTDCETQGYQLIVLDTLTKSLTMADILTASLTYTENGYWVGLSGSVGWVDGSTFTSANWATSEENLQSGMCVRLDRNSGYKWMNDHCNSGQSYICQAV